MYDQNGFVHQTYCTTLTLWQDSLATNGRGVAKADLKWRWDFHPVSWFTHTTYSSRHLRPFLPFAFAATMTTSDFYTQKNSIPGLIDELHKTFKTGSVFEPK